ncbi:MAG TPA: diguanylate cyclase [Negativicutes bacterium]
MKSTKIILLVLFFIVLSIIIYSRSFFDNEISTIQRNVVLVKDEYIPELRYIIDTREKINKVPLLVSKLVITPNPEKKKYNETQVNNLITEIDGELQHIFAVHGQPNAAPLHRYIANNWTGYKNVVFKIIHPEQSDDAEQLTLDLETSLVFLERLNTGMKMIADFHQSVVSQKTEQVVNITLSSKQKVLVIAGLTTMTFVLIGFVTFDKIMLSEGQLRRQVIEVNKKNLLLEEQSKEINQLACYDTLTGLPNRHFFQMIMAEELSPINTSAKKGALVFLDIDNFKTVNDTYGHDMGDHFLVTVGNSINSLCDEQIFAARFGGDEFALLLRGFDDTTVGLILDKLLALVATPLKIQNVCLFPTCSIGVAFYPQHGNNLSDLLKKADIAMYQAKVTLNSYVIYRDKVG